LSYAQSQTDYPKAIVINNDSLIAITREQYFDCSKYMTEIDRYRKGARDCNTAKNICELRMEGQETEITNLNEQIRIMNQAKIIYAEQTETSQRQLRNQRVQKWISITIATALAIVAIYK